MAGMLRKTKDWRRWWLSLEGAGGAHGAGDDGGGFADDDGVAVGSGGDVEGVFEDAGDGAWPAVVFWGCRRGRRRRV